MSWTLVSEYLDHETGKHADREQFKRMFQHASQRKFDVVLFWSLDRLSREGVLETLQHLQRLTDYGVEWRSLTEQYLDSTGIFRDAVISILATVAKQERIRISERVTAGLARAKAKGKRLGRPKAIADASRIAELRAQGLGWKKISRELKVGVGTVLGIAQEAGKSGSENVTRQIFRTPTRKTRFEAAGGSAVAAAFTDPNPIIPTLR